MNIGHCEANAPQGGVVNAPEFTCFSQYFAYNYYYTGDQCLFIGLFEPSSDETRNEKITR